jgi:hypothetical protein
MKTFKVIRRIQVKDWITQEFLIEAESESEIENMSDEEFYDKCSFGEIIGRDYDDEPTGYDKLSDIEEAL